MLDEKVEKNLEELEECLRKSAASYENDPKQFYQKGIFQMGAFIRLYADLMRTLGVKLRDDVLNECNEANSNRLEKLFYDWDHFLDHIESHQVNTPKLPQNNNLK